MYPFSTQNAKDYYNLMDVYLDAAFFPRLDPLSYVNGEYWSLGEYLARHGFSKADQVKKLSGSQRSQSRDDVDQKASGVVGSSA